MHNIGRQFIEHGSTTINLVVCFSSPPSPNFVSVNPSRVIKYRAWKSQALLNRLQSVKPLYSGLRGGSISAAKGCLISRADLSVLRELECIWDSAKWCDGLTSGVAFACEALTFSVVK